MAHSWNIHHMDKPLVERAIGAAILDHLRGFKTSLAQAYRTKGGQDQDTVSTLNQFEDQLSSGDWDKTRKALAPDGDFRSAFKNWDMSSHELALVERAIGSAMLAELQGEDAHFHEHYERLGGKNAEARQALQKAGEVARSARR